MEVDGLDSGTHVYSKPKVIIVAATKGGTVKRTLAINLAVAAQSRGMKTVIIDTDIEGDSGQGSCLKWKSRREKPMPFVKGGNLNNLAVLISKAWVARYKVVIVDTAGRSTPDFKSAGGFADFILIPSQATILDAEAVEAILRQARASDVRTGIVLTQVLQENHRRTQRYRQKYSAMATVFQTTIRRRVDYADAIARGLGVTEYHDDGDCDVEVQTLLNEILDSINQ
ncbi:AAA family ATPase [Devosia sp. MC532]|uniref:nucleotide-binding protein n=1 Tax=Devosia sp. MC532 TaxID=2799788 RepID=UPI0018F66B01|nr:AAA family ATPase [Devosia sp. MC532]MBJ7578425.1 AAA family ATPase [Devosia sp. MC532]